MALSTISCAATKPSVRQEAVQLASLGRSAAAVELLRGYLRRTPGAVSERRLLVRLLGVTGQLADAEREAHHLARLLGVHSPLPWLELGHAHELAHRFEEALAWFDRAAEVAPSDPIGPRTGGLRAAIWGEVDWAAPRLEESLRRDPRDARVWHALGLIRVHQGRLAEAHRAYMSGLRADPRALENHIGLATLALVSDDPATALREYDIVLKSRPRFADAHLGRSWALLELGRLDEAARAMDEAERLGAAPGVILRQREQLRLRRRSR